jgi:phage repressor protein C with HTH and peptisase S24 domain
MRLAETVFAEAVAKRLKALDDTAFAVEQRHGLPEDSIRSILRGIKKSGTTLNNAQRVCAALDLELYIGPRRDTGPVETLAADDDDYVLVPRLDVRLSAGPGAVNETANRLPNVLERIAFRRGWLASIVDRVSDAVLVRVAGESMAPTLHDRDLALVDTGRRTIRSGRVYAVTDLDGATRVKRLDLVPGSGLILRSDAPDFPAEARFGADAERVEVHGQVVWSGHAWKK